MMKKGLLAVAALTGAALTTNAATLKVSDQTFANFGLKLQIYGQVIDDGTSYQDARGNTHHDTATDFTIQNARVYFSGQLNPIVQFGANLDFTVTGQNTSHEGTSSTKVRDAFINFHFMDELNVMAGYYRIPFNRETLTDRYDRIFMPQDGWVTLQGVYKDQILPTLQIGHWDGRTRVFTPVGNAYLTSSNVMGGPSLGNAIALTQTTDEADFARDAGVTIWGTVLKGMVRYYVGIYDGFGDHNAAEATLGDGKDNLGYGIRVEFTPTMLGFQGDKGFLRKETYLGKKNDFTIGIGYYSSKLDYGNGINYTFKSWAADLNYEQKFGVFVPKLEVGYVQTDGDDLGVATANPIRIGNTDVPAGTFVGTLDKVKTYSVTVGVLYDQKLFLGKLGAYIKYQKTKVDLNNVPRAVARILGDTSIEPTVWSIAIPYYLADQNAKIVLQYNKYDYDINGFDPRNPNNDDSNSDWTLAFQVQF